MLALIDAPPGAHRSLGKAAFYAATALLGLALLTARAGAYTVGSRTRGGGEIMTNEKVISLCKAGFAEDIVIRKVEGASRTHFDLTTKGMVQLKQAGVGDEIIRIMLRIYEEEAKLHDRTIRVHVQLFRSEVSEDYERAVRVLVRYGAYAVPMLVENVTNEDERIRAGVCEALGRIGDPPSLEPLLEALLDRNNAVRAKAAKAVSLFDRSEVLPHIERAVERRGGPRDGYALALGYVGDIRHQKTLIEIADSPGPESDRAAAAYALGLLGDARPEAVRVLIEAALNDTYRQLREAATRALGRLGEEMEPHLRLEAGLALAKSMQRHKPSRAMIARELRFFPGRRTVETLLAHLGSRDLDVSTASWESLKAATGEVWPRDVDRWRSWWEIAQLQPRWQGERFLPASGAKGPALGAEEEPDEGAAPEAGLGETGAGVTAPETDIPATPPPAPEDPFVR